MNRSLLDPNIKNLIRVVPQKGNKCSMIKNNLNFKSFFFLNVFSWMNTKASCGDNSQDNFTSTVEQVFLNQLYI